MAIDTHRSSDMHLSSGTQQPGGGQDSPPAAQQSIGELIRSLTEQTARLVREEVQLAGIELTEKGKRAAAGAGMFGAAGLVAAYGGAALVTCAIGALCLVMAVWAAALIVAVALFAVAGGLALAGRRTVREAAPPAPRAALAGLHADVATVREALR